MHTMYPFHSFGLLAFGALISVLVIIPYWSIFKKAGFSPLLSLLMIVPVINAILLYFLAFARWKVVPASQVYPAPPPGA